MQYKDMTTKEAAEYLGVSTDTIYRMARAGELPCYKIRSMYRFQKEFLDEWKRQQQMKSLFRLNKEVVSAN